MKKSIVLATVLVVTIAGLTLSNLQPAISANRSRFPGASQRGASQRVDVSGGLSATLFNGEVRIRRMDLSQAYENIPTGVVALLFSWRVSNGTRSARRGDFAASIWNADGTFINGTKANTSYSLRPGAEGHGTIQFVIPPGFVPTKILLVDRGCLRCPAFRIHVQR